MRTLDTLKYKSSNPIKKFLIRRFQKELLKLVKYALGEKVLDMGCGEGHLLAFLDSQIQDWHIEGFDISEESVKKARDKVPSAIFSVRDIYNSGYPEASFDLVLNTEVLEHLKEPEKVLSEIRRLTKKWAILSVPNEPLFSISNLLSGKDILRIGRHKDHCNNWSTTSFISLLNKYFKVSCVAKPFPWTIVLCEKRTNE